ncbi:MAG: SDR family oxidoreductase [Gammaproteobacteria bacterium]|nr:SDR family oxidoreductase [Gammaproteobacteria bacterium]
MRLDNKVIFITGGGTGIGAATTRYMLNLGAKVAIAGIPAAPLESLADELGPNCLALPTDVTDEGQVAAAIAATVEAFGDVDAVVANAGIQRHKTDIDITTMDEVEWERTQDVNLRGVFRTVKHGLAQMIRQGHGGSVVIVSSITAISGGSANVSYMTAKSGLLGLNRHIAVHYAKHGIRSNAVCPGALEQTPDWAEHPNQDGRRRAMERDIPLGRLGKSEDIAPFIAFLTSDDASYSTGAQYVIDGGITIR